MKDPDTELMLVDEINSVSDVNRLITELENIEDFFLKMKVKSSLSQVEIPKTSARLEELAKKNTLNLIKAEDRLRLKKFLHFLRTKAPIIHISFGVVPEDQFVGRISNWFRTEVNPYALLSVSLQPNIGAGFRMRTTNKLYDFSLNQYLIANKSVLAKALGMAPQL
ncbi:MAG TPA: hypothetical protein VMV24_02395 [Candidatus Dormibacteraeota bacterium]|nr:hypothetical protein [Candidatus Dormibacteraeota bacterium]